MLLEAIHAQKRADEMSRGHVTWPSSKYSHDPIAFCTEILGYAPTTKQALILLAARDHERVTVRSGRKIGKSRTAAALALWFFCTNGEATVVLCAPCERQITEIVWHDLVQLVHDSGRCLACRLRDSSGPRPCAHSTPIDGELSASVRTGLRADGRRIFGLSPRNSDNARGVSGPQQLWLLDESPGIANEIYTAADGNRAGGAKLVAFGNPSARGGWFYDSHTSVDFHRIAVDSRSSPNVTLGRRVVPGLADPGWIEEKRADFGEDDPRWFVDVLGEFPTRDMDRVVTEQDYAAAVERWDTLPDEGPLYFGIDPAGGGGGDESVIVARRGAKVLTIRAFQGGTDLIMSEFAALVKTYRFRRTDHVHINFDAASSYGSDLANALRMAKLRDDFLSYDALESRGDARQIYALKQTGCARPKDAFWMNAAQRIKTEVGLPFDDELREELLFAEWQQDRDGGTRLIEKRTFRKRIGRSPDRSDALAYCLWEGRVAPLSRAAMREPDLEPEIYHGSGRIDPYAAQDGVDARDGTRRWLDEDDDGDRREDFVYGPATSGRRMMRDDNNG